MYIGIDIGGTKCAVTGGMFLDGRIEIVHKKKIETPKDRPPEEVIEILADEVMKWSEEKTSVGISCGGPLNSREGIILSPPNLTGWDHVCITSIMEERLKIPAYLQNDANAGALAEWLFGAGKGIKNLIFLTFGTGMGAGLILNGGLYAGAQDLAGEVGHIRLEPFGPAGFGKMGSFEGFCSGGGIALLAEAAAKEREQQGRKTAYWVPGKTITARCVAECAKRGDETATEVFRICGEKLGKALALLIDTLNPEMIILGSIYGRCRELLEPSMRQVLERECLPGALENCRILSAVLGEEIGDYAALATAVYGRKEWNCMTDIRH